MSKDLPEPTPDELIKTLIDNGFAKVENGIITMSFSEKLLKDNPEIASFMQLLMDEMKKGENKSLSSGYVDVAVDDEGYAGKHDSESPGEEVEDPKGELLLNHLYSKGSGRQ